MKRQDDEAVKHQVDEFIGRFKTKFPVFSDGSATVLNSIEVMELVVRVILFREQELQGK